MMADSENQDTKPTEDAVAEVVTTEEAPAAETPDKPEKPKKPKKSKKPEKPTAEAAEVVAAKDEPEAPAPAASEAGTPEDSETPEAVADADAAAAPAAEAVAPEAGAPADKPKKRGRPRAKLDQLEVGSDHKGKVVGLAKFGAFVDIGAVTDGLVHVTELSQKRVRKVEDAVAMGDEVEVWIKDVDLQSGRVSLSMRRRPTRPLAELKGGDVLAGTVTSTTKYGVFVDIGSETEGLVHISEMSSGYVERPADVASSGDAVEVRVKEIDAARERISLSMIGLANDVGADDAAEAMAVAQYASGEMASDEPVERMPTVVELALRRALGEMQDDADTDGETDGDADADAGAVDADIVADVEAADEKADAEAEVPVEPVEEAAADGAAAPPEEEDGDSLGEMYERMIAAYKAEKTQQG